MTDISGVIQGHLPGQEELRRWVEARKAYWANPPYGDCSTCGRKDCLLGDDDPRCADCRVKAANRHQAQKFYPCDKCGEPGAIRDPAHRRDEYLCMDCHEANGYIPTQRSMVNKTAARVGVEHSMARRITCAAAGKGTDCRGEIKWRGPANAQLCNFHNNPRLYLANKGE